MTPIEKFERLCKTQENVSLHKYLSGGRAHYFIGACGVGLSKPARAIADEAGSSLSAKEAIDTAYDELFPPIPRKVGCWEWKYDVKAYCSGDSVPLYIRCDQGGGWKVSYLSGSLESPTLMPSEINDLPKLLKVNPGLKPPTDEAAAGDV